jgi:POT family proton-dependent oligopeptide transporter
MSTTLSAPAPTSQLKHPLGLYVLFGAEMWERLSYYGMRALLVLYLTSHLKFERADALNLYAIYTGLVYLTPLLGGFLADQVLGQRKAVFIGGTLMAIGHFAMAFEEHLYLALGLIILGNGFFKPNISTMVGQLYAPGDRRRDSAYTIFYMGINTGAFLAPLVCGTLGESKSFGWHWGFGAAGVGMVFGLINFALGQKTLGDQGFPPGQPKGESRLSVMDFLHILLVTLLGVATVYVAIVPASTISNYIAGWPQMPVFGYWVLLSLAMAAGTWMIAGGRARKAGAEISGDPETGNIEKEPFTTADWLRVVVILIVAIFSIAFWMGFEQAGGTFTLFAKEKTDRSLPEFAVKMLGEPEFPASWYQTINPLLIVLMAPMMIALWSALERVGIRFNSAVKMGIGMLILGAGFVVMSYADKHSSASSKAGPHWLLIVYLFNSVGELCLSPIGLSLVNKLAHKRIASFMMAFWFFCTAIANYLAGIMEAYLKKNAPDLDLFTFLIYTSVGTGVVLLILSPLLQKMSQNRL